MTPYFAKTTRRFRKELFLFFSSALFLLLTGVSLAVYFTLFDQLKKGENESITHLAQIRSMAITEWCHRAKDLARQITSRTRIRQELEKYNEGQIDLKSLAGFIKPKLEDAMNLSDEIVGIIRLDRKGQVVVTCGYGSDLLLKRNEILGFVSKDVELSEPIQVGKHSLILVSAPIINRAGKRQGTDLVIIDLNRLEKIVSNSEDIGKTKHIFVGYPSKSDISRLFSIRKNPKDFSRKTQGYHAVRNSVLNAINGEKGLKSISDTVIAYQPIEGCNWGLAIYQRRLELYSAIYKKMAYIAGISLAVYFLILLAFWFLLEPLAGRILLRNDELEKRIREKTAVLENEIAERKKAGIEKEAAQRIAGMGDFTWEVETGKTSWSKGMYDLLGYDKSEEIDFAKVNAEIHHPDDPDKITNWLNECLESGKSHFPPNEYRLIRKDGRILNVRTNVSVKYKDGKPFEMIGTCIDFTEQKRQQAERERLMMAIEQAAETIVITDTEGSIRYANPAFERITGYTREEAIGRNPRVLKSGEHDDAFYREMWGTLTRGETWTGRLVNKKKDGALYTEEAVISPVRDEMGRTVNYVAVKRDISHEVALDAQLRQAQKMEAVGRLAGGVAHDFNNMLSVILGHAEMVLEEMIPDQPFHTDLEEIKKAAERSADLTRQLLAFARKQTVAPKVIDLNKVVAGMTRMLERLIGEDIEMAWLPGRNLWSVKIDPSQIDQIMANLCVNARDAIAGVGKVTIETDNTTFDEAYCADHIGFTPGEYAMLAVSDSGCGMDAEVLDEIFEPFFTTKGQGKGTGLGLATVYGVVKQNNGFINVYSESGQGTTFKIYLPRHRVKADPLPEKGTEKQVERGHETILLVEDEPAILRMTSMMLEREGYTVVGAGTPGEAIRLANEHAGTIHLLMTDVVMPEMNGRDLARNFLSLYPGAKCLFMSGYTANVIAHQGVLDEGVNFIQKPFSKGDLAAKVREALERE